MLSRFRLVLSLSVKATFQFPILPFVNNLFTKMGSYQQLSVDNCGFRALLTPFVDNFTYLSTLGMQMYRLGCKREYVVFNI